MKRDYTALSSFITLIILAIVVYFGRIFFPQNFHPDTISFIENYIVLGTGFCLVTLAITIIIFGTIYFYNELLKDIKSLLKK